MGLHIFRTLRSGHSVDSCSASWTPGAVLRSQRGPDPQCAGRPEDSPLQQAVTYKRRGSILVHAQRFAHLLTRRQVLHTQCGPGRHHRRGTHGLPGAPGAFRVTSELLYYEPLEMHVCSYAQASALCTTWTRSTPFPRR